MFFIILYLLYYYYNRKHIKLFISKGFIRTFLQLKIERNKAFNKRIKYYIGITHTKIKLNNL